MPVVGDGGSRKVLVETPARKGMQQLNCPERKLSLTAMIATTAITTRMMTTYRSECTWPALKPALNTQRGPFNLYNYLGQEP